jgi:hypothetical protein
MPARPYGFEHDAWIGLVIPRGTLTETNAPRPGRPAWFRQPLSAEHGSPCPSLDASVRGGPTRGLRKAEHAWEYHMGLSHVVFTGDPTFPRPTVARVSR